eukprot:TRINITY_DN928_c0_g3_i2.p2 TRINITY_DN928_c0_g3~~TRINITY_DN928_c0_g3_i2.p2  ORF type:complete len:224 (-),score=47.93 TRINITY_DN928_c0_g3_i2:798-1469(-)
MLEPGKIETWNVIIDVKNESYVSVTMGSVGPIRTVIQALQDYFPCHVERIFIVNPSSSFKALLSLVDGVTSQTTRSKIINVQGPKFEELSKYIPREQLEKKFGGYQNDLTQFFPPLNTLSVHDKKWLMPLRYAETRPRREEQEEAAKEYEEMIHRAESSPISKRLTERRHTAIRTTRRSRSPIAPSWRKEQEEDDDYCGLKLTAKKNVQTPNHTNEDDDCRLI